MNSNIQRIVQYQFFIVARLQELGFAPRAARELALHPKLLKLLNVLDQESRTTTMTDTLGRVCDLCLSTREEMRPFINPDDDWRLMVDNTAEIVFMFFEI